MEIVTCSFVTSYKSFKGPKELVKKRRCNQQVTLRPSLGGYLSGTCSNGHINGKKVKNGKV